MKLPNNSQFINISGQKNLFLNYFLYFCIEMNKIKVLEVIRQGQIGGGESHLLDLVTFLDKERFEPVCLSFTSGEMFKRLETMGIQCSVIATLSPIDLKIQRKTTSFICE